MKNKVAFKKKSRLSSLFYGINSLFNWTGMYIDFDYEKEFGTDEDLLLSDWKKIGDDLRKVNDKFIEELDFYSRWFLKNRDKLIKEFNSGFIAVGDSGLLAYAENLSELLIKIGILKLEEDEYRIFSI